MSDYTIIIIWVVKIFFVQFFCVFLPPLLNIFCFLLGPYHFYPLLCPSLHEMFPCISNFLEEISSVSHSIVFLYFFARGRLSYLFLLFFGTVNSNGYIFPFLLCFSQLFVRPPQTALLLFCISFAWGWSWFLSPVQCHKPPFIVHQALCLSDLVP